MLVSTPARAQFAGYRFGNLAGRAAFKDACRTALDTMKLVAAVLTHTPEHLSLEVVAELHVNAVNAAVSRRQCIGLPPVP